MGRKEKIHEAIDTFGKDVVAVVQEACYLGDPDGAYSMIEDMGMFEHAECVAAIYFED